MLELRRFQEKTLKDLTLYLDALIEKAKEQVEYNEFLKSKGGELEERNIPAQAWAKVTDKPESDHKTRIDGLGQSIPHICLKIPTGGGKTLLATHAVKLINQHYFKRNTGLILWVMPSEAIYSQTLKNFKDYDHPYREVLDQAAPGRRATILERKRMFSPRDVEESFSVMLLMLQASARETKEQLRMFRDSGGYIDFFPAPDDHPNHHKIYCQTPNFDVHKSAGHRTGYEPLVVKCSLGNVLRLLRPIIVIDEGHKAYSQKASDTMNGFNPRFILELSATPKVERSNILVNVSGQDLKDEQMIKLPIQIKNVSGSDWQTTLSDSCERLKELDKKAKQYQAGQGKYIRPILLVRVERTGSDQRGRGFLHAEDVREYLTQQLSFRPDEVRVKGGGKNEIADDDLMSPFCSVRVIITKAALQEGWDCPFAYVLALLDKGTANTALTQMVGRVLRQPYAQTSGMTELDTAHVFCFDQNVKQAIQQIRKGLQREGLGDLEGGVISDEEQEMSNWRILRREQFRQRDIVLPRVLHREGDTVRPLDYERDILSGIKWEKIKHSRQGILLEDKQAVTKGQVDIDDQQTTTHHEALEGEANAVFFATNLSDIVPNPWQAMRISKEIMPVLKKQGSSIDIYNDRMNIIRKMRNDIEKQKDDHAEKLFQRKLCKKEIVFDLDTTNGGWKIPEEIRIQFIGKPKYLTHETGEQLSLSFFEKYEERDFNHFEKKIASYLDEAKALKWWHRVAARQEYGLQGWRKHLVYPDFIAFISKDKDNHIILETKGAHLKGNEDTKYKEALFKVLEKNVLDIGSVKISNGDETITLRMIFECNWKESLQEMDLYP